MKKKAGRAVTAVRLVWAGRAGRAVSVFCLCLLVWESLVTSRDLRGGAINAYSPSFGLGLALLPPCWPLLASAWPPLPSAWPPVGLRLASASPGLGLRWPPLRLGLASVGLFTKRVGTRRLPNDSVVIPNGRVCESVQCKRLPDRKFVYERKHGS